MGGGDWAADEKQVSCSSRFEYESTSLLLMVKRAKLAMPMPIPLFLAKAQKTRESWCPPTYSFSKFPLGVSFNRNNLQLPSFNWCFYDLWVLGEGKWEYPIPLLFIARKSSSTECQKIRLQHVFKLQTHSANVTKKQTDCFFFGINVQRWVARFPFPNSQCISINKWDLFTASLCLDLPLIL